MGERGARDLRVLFLFPLVWRPEKANFARRFERLSERIQGEILSLSGSRQQGLPLGRFRFHSEPFHGNVLMRFISRLRLQLWLPIRLFRRGSLDCVIAYDPYGSGLNGLLLKFLLGTRLIIELNGDHHQHRPADNPLKNWIMGLVLRACLSQADAIKVVNTSLEHYVKRRFPAKPVFRFFDFVADGYFRGLDCSQGDYLLSIGHPFGFKGVPELIEAFHAVALRHPKLRLHIMGHCPPEELSQFRALARDDPRIEFIPPGWIEDVGEQMRSCYALVHASHFDAAPRVLFEAMACRKPVLATRTNGGIDYVADGETGLLCEVRDVKDLTSKLEALVSDPRRARAMGEAGLARVAQEYSESCYAEHVFGMLQGVLGGERKAFGKSR
jgi:glycosyltransferase involved in cell wall biosynthesis